MYCYCESAVQEQGSQAWLQFRKNKIGSSDIAKILDISPYGTPYSLWLEKTGRKETKLNPAMEKGVAFEESIRQMAESAIGLCFMPAVFISEPYPWAMASCDGISLDEKQILECKYASKDLFDMVKAGEIPDHYMAQCQWLLQCVPTADILHFCCYNEGYDDLICKTVERSWTWSFKMIAAAQEFYNIYMLQDLPPPLSEKDYAHIEDPDAVNIANQLYDNILKIDQLQAEQEKLRNALILFANDKNFCCGPIKGCHIKGKTSYDYKKACTDHRIDLEQYKKTSSDSWRITKQRQE